MKIGTAIIPVILFKRAVQASKINSIQILD
jgi:hypothetical protein